MTPTELRALIASEQLASLASANAENGWPCTNDQLMADAIELADMLLAKLNGDAPDPTRPVAPWLDATDPNNDPDDGDNAWVAVKGRKGWTVALCLWDEGRSAWWVVDDLRLLFGFINHRDVECYHCPSDSFESLDDAVASLPN